MLLPTYRIALCCTPSANFLLFHQRQVHIFSSITCVQKSSGFSQLVWSSFKLLTFLYNRNCVKSLERFTRTQPHKIFGVPIYPWISITNIVLIHFFYSCGWWWQILKRLTTHKLDSFSDGRRPIAQGPYASGAERLLEIAQCCHFQARQNR